MVEGIHGFGAPMAATGAGRCPDAATAGIRAIGGGDAVKVVIEP